MTTADTIPRLTVWNTEATDGNHIEVFVMAYSIESNNGVGISSRETDTEVIFRVNNSGTGFAIPKKVASKPFKAKATKSTNKKNRKNKRKHSKK